MWRPLVKVGVRYPEPPHPTIRKLRILRIGSSLPRFDRMRQPLQLGENWPQRIPTPLIILHLFLFLWFLGRRTAHCDLVEISQGPDGRLPTQLRTAIFNAIDELSPHVR